MGQKQDVWGEHRTNRGFPADIVSSMLTPDFKVRQRAVGVEEKTAFQAKGTPYSKAWKQNICETTFHKVILHKPCYCMA